MDKTAQIQRYQELHAFYYNDVPALLTRQASAIWERKSLWARTMAKIKVAGIIRKGVAAKREMDALKLSML